MGLCFSGLIDFFSTHTVGDCFCTPQPLIIVANKCDVKKISELSEENQVGGLQVAHLKDRNV